VQAPYDARDDTCSELFPIDINVAQLLPVGRTTS
jgi:hypothetical protein